MIEKKYKIEKATGKPNYRSALEIVRVKNGRATATDGRLLAEVPTPGIEDGDLTPEALKIGRAGGAWQVSEPRQNYPETAHTVKTALGNPIAKKICLNATLLRNALAAIGAGNSVPVYIEIPEDSGRPVIFSTDRQRDKDSPFAILMPLVAIQD